jgi:hypothetical protein
MSDSSHLNSPSRTPVYFLGIGGPNFMEDTAHPAYAKLAAVGQEITKGQTQGSGRLFCPLARRPKQD